MSEASLGEETVEAVSLLDAASESEARALLVRCCGARRWVDGMLARRPFRSASALRSAASEVWALLGREDYLEAFAEHPAIGADLAQLEARLAATKAWSSGEQAGVNRADPATLRALAAGNHAYRERFGYTFIVCATGRSAREMLGALVERLEHDPETELFTAAQEQQKITLLRLDKIAVSSGSPPRGPP